MKMIPIIITIFILFSGCAGMETRPGVVISWSFADRNEAADKLAVKDDYIVKLSDFDRELIIGQAQPCTDQELLDHIKNQILDWDEKDKELIRTPVSRAIDKMSSFPLNLPDGILIIKTTGKECGDAAYTRANTIVLPQNAIKQPSETIDYLIIHETFHILTRYNPGLRTKLYEIIHFYPCPELTVPAELEKLMITNPDDPDNDYYIELNYDNRINKCIPIIFANKPFDPNNAARIFDYFSFKLIIVEEKNGETIPVYRDNTLQLLPPDSVSDYLVKVGRNTKYTISPEEILADNFFLMINRNTVPNPSIIEKMKTVINDFAVE